MINFPSEVSNTVKRIAFYMKKSLFIIPAVALYMTFAGQAFAAGNSTVYGGYGGYQSPCKPIYGGGETCISKGNISLNKTVMNPSTKEFVDNLSLSNDAKYADGQDVTFKLTVTNTGDKTLKEVQVMDTLPSALKFTAGPGTYDSKTKTVSFKTFDLKAGESRDFTITAKASNPTNQAVACVINQAKAVSNGNESSDIAQVCVEKTVVTTKGGNPVMDTPKGMTKTPGTGPEMLALVGLIPAAGAGMFLRRKSK